MFELVAATCCGVSECMGHGSSKHAWSCRSRFLLDADKRED